MSWLRRGMKAVVAVGLCLTAIPLAVDAIAPSPPFITPTANWLTTVNYYRAMAKLPPVTANSTWSAADKNHSCWMLYNGIQHGEAPGTAFYTASGDGAGKTGNVAVSTDINASARSFIELWMTGPFHAIGILRYNLQATGFGMCTGTTSPKWRSAATLDVIHGLSGDVTRPSSPILWPGNGTTTNLSKFRVETPNPLTYCGSSWVAKGAGLPVIAMMPEAITTVKATITGPDGVIPSCALWASKTPATVDAAWATAKVLLGGDNVVTVLPNAELQPGVYRVSITTQKRSISWSFTVDPTAATGVMPIPTVTRANASSTFHPMTPFRFADTRFRLRVTPLLAGVPKRIKIAGTAGISTAATDLSANITVAGSTGASHLTVYNCSAKPPNVSTINYAKNQVIANAGVWPLSARSSAVGFGYLCLYSPVNTQVIIDVTGYFTSSTAGRRYTATTPRPWVSTRLAAKGEVALKATTVGLPADARNVAVNLTVVNPSATGYLVAYACGTTRPKVSNLSFTPTATRQNFALVPLSAAGTICVYTTAATSVKVDLLGSFSSRGTGTLVPTVPTRLVDTRDSARQLMNLGTAGSRMAPSITRSVKLAGQRGIPSKVKAVALNVTVFSPTSSGSVTVWGGSCDSVPGVRTVNFSSGKTVANTAMVSLGATGAVCVRSTTGAHVIIDINGYWN